jgi:hypothetical protein
MGQELASLLTGLTQGVTKYLDLGNQMKANGLQEQQKAASALNLKTAESALDINKGQQIEKYKVGLEDVLSPDMAEQALPGYGAKMVTDYNTQHKDNPLKLKDGLSFLKQAHEALDPSTSANSKQQDKLEAQYTETRKKVLSNRSGGLGLQDSKVNMAIDLRNAINQFYDPATDRYNIPPSMHEEIALGVAKLLSPTGVAPEGLVEKLKQGTAREKLANGAIYLGLADPEKIGGPTQDVAKLFVDTIDRQGVIAERLRNHYESGLKGLAPSGLNADRKSHIDSADLTNSFTNELNKAPDYIKHQKAAEANHPVGKVSVVNPQGQKGFIPAGQLEEALKHGFKQAE